MTSTYVIRKAEERDIASIHRLLDIYARKQVVLPRSEDDIRCYLKNFTVAVDGSGETAGCVAIRDFGNNLLEVRSLVVHPDLQNSGIGRLIIEHCIAFLRESRREFRLFALTLSPGFFLKLGFSLADRDLFPEKIWSDCASCPKRFHCDETAVLLSVPDR